MQKLIDYTKYTIALGVGLLLYIPANFIPAPNNEARLFLAVLMIVLAVSVVCGILLYTRVTKILIENSAATEDEKVYTRLWGRSHLWTLLVAFVCIAPYFGYHKVWTPSAKSECSAELTLATGNVVPVTFPCNLAAGEKTDVVEEEEGGN